MTSTHYRIETITGRTNTACGRRVSKFDVTPKAHLVDCSACQRTHAWRHENRRDIEAREEQLKRAETRPFVRAIAKIRGISTHEAVRLTLNDLTPAEIEAALEN